MLKKCLPCLLLIALLLAGCANPMRPVYRFSTIQTCVGPDMLVPNSQAIITQAFGRVSSRYWVSRSLEQLSDKNAILHPPSYYAQLSSTAHRQLGIKRINIGAYDVQADKWRETWHRELYLITDLEAQTLADGVTLTPYLLTAYTGRPTSYHAYITLADICYYVTFDLDEDITEQNARRDALFVKQASTYLSALINI